MTIAQLSDPSLSTRSAAKRRLTPGSWFSKLGDGSLGVNSSPLLLLPGFWSLGSSITFIAAAFIAPTAPTLSLTLTFLDTHCRTLSLELLGQSGACSHSREVLCAEDLKDVAVYGSSDAALAILGRIGHADLHQREAQPIMAILAAGEVRENEETAKAGIVITRLGCLGIITNKRRSD